jgi:hypothetical protein
MLSILVGLALTYCVALAAAQDPQVSTRLPSREEVDAVEQRCVANHTGLPAEKMNAAVSAWSGASADASPADSRKLLSAAFARIRREDSLSPQKDAYLTCVENGLSQYIDQQQLKPPAEGSLIDSSLLPTKPEAASRERNCLAAGTIPTSFKAKVDAAIDSWLSVAATGSQSQATLSLDVVFEPMANGGSLSPYMSMYLTCVKGELRKFMTQAEERPRQVHGVGNSRLLLRASFASDQEMWHSGCQEAETTAVEKLRAGCGGRVFFLQNSQCTQGDGDSRTYSAQVFGECRVR